MYLFIRSSTNPGPRVARIIRYFEQKGKKIVYLSPKREGDIADSKYRDFGSLGQFEYFDGVGMIRYLAYITTINLLVARIIFRHRRCIKFVHFSDLEVVLLGAIMCRVLGIRFVYNIHDNFFQRYDFGAMISLALRYLESFYISISAKTLVPETYRRNCFSVNLRRKICVLKNFPDFDVSTPRRPFSDKSIFLFYGGWISPNRSIELYFDLADALILRGYTVSFILCGWGDRTYLESLASIANRKGIVFKYLGQLSQESSVENLKKADISIAYYPPDKTINIFAASNKIPEIIGSSTVLITNIHTEIAKAIRPLNISLQFDSSITEVIDKLVALMEDESAMAAFDDRAKKFYLDEYNPQILAADLEELFYEFV